MERAFLGKRETLMYLSPQGGWMWGRTTGAASRQRPQPGAPLRTHGGSLPAGGKGTACWASLVCGDSGAPTPGMHGVFFTLTLPPGFLENQVPNQHSALARGMLGLPSPGGRGVLTATRTPRGRGMSPAPACPLRWAPGSQPAADTYSVPHLAPRALHGDVCQVSGQKTRSCRHPWTSGSVTVHIKCPEEGHRRPYKVSLNYILCTFRLLTRCVWFRTV